MVFGGVRGGDETQPSSAPLRGENIPFPHMLYGQSVRDGSWTAGCPAPFISWPRMMLKVRHWEHFPSFTVPHLWITWMWLFPVEPGVPDTAFHFSYCHVWYSLIGRGITQMKLIKCSFPHEPSSTRQQWVLSILSCVRNVLKHRNAYIPLWKSFCAAFIVYCQTGPESAKDPWAIRKT